MSETPPLRAVRPDERPTPPGQTPKSTHRPSWLLLTLVSALTIVILFLAWSRTRLETRIEALEAETIGLRAELDRRDRLVEAQGARLGEVRTGVDALRDLLEEPLPTSD
jgi:hypothetical protein